MWSWGYKGRMGAWKKGELCLDGIRKIAYVLSRVNGINNGITHLRNQQHRESWY